MKRFTLILTAVLALQLVLALGLTFSGSDYAAHDANEPLLAFDKEKVDEIVINEDRRKFRDAQEAGRQMGDPGNDGFPGGRRARGRSHR